MVHHGHAALDGIQAVGGVWKRQLEELGLVDEFLHVRVVFLFFVEYPRAQPVERLQVRFDTRGLIGLLSRIFANEELRLPLGPLIAKQGFNTFLYKGALGLFFSDVPYTFVSPATVLF